MKDKADGRPREDVVPNIKIEARDDALRVIADIRFEGIARL
jgi:hypothetical protein